MPHVTAMSATLREVELPTAAFEVEYLTADGVMDW
jgi:hypothetical protein